MHNRLVHTRFETSTAIVLPGTGSDAQFAQEAFGQAFEVVGLTTVAVEPDPTGVVRSYLGALDDAVRAHGPVVVAGISLGAAVAAHWAERNRSSVVALALALPAWTGDPTGSPAALSARFTAGSLRERGLDSVTATMAESSPEWLARTLARSWASQWPALPRALDEAASYRGPELDRLARIDAPTVVVGAVDDPVHPIAVAEQWARALPRGVLRTVTLTDIGLDPAVLGREAVDALTAALDG